MPYAMINLLFRYKHTKIEFDKRLMRIVNKIKGLRQEVVGLNKLVNMRNGSIVRQIAE
jgi:negative regulator of sigma E activity